jgi:hypothetical protein
MFVCCECCVLSGRGLCGELITRPGEYYRLWCVVVCDLENLKNEPMTRVESQRKRKLRIYSFADGYINESRHCFVILTISTLIRKNDVSLSVYNPSMYKPMSTSNLKHNAQRKEYFHNYSYNLIRLKVNLVVLYCGLHYIFTA